MANNYTFKGYDKDNMARVLGRALPISFKQSVEICSMMRNRDLSYAKDILSKVIEHKKAVPFRRFRHNIGHKTKIGPGRYPEKASNEILKLINSVEANAQFKGLNTSNLVITHINANEAGKVMRAGRKRSRRAKRTNVEIVIQEKKMPKKDAKTDERKAKTADKEIKPKQGEKKND